MAESKLRPIVNEIFTAKELEPAKKLLSDFISTSTIKASEKSKMLLKIRQIESLQKLQYYVANSMLYFEGMASDSASYVGT